MGTTLGEVHPADLESTYAVLIVIGGIAGLFAGVAFGITGLFGPRDPSGKAVPAKPLDVADELWLAPTVERGTMREAGTVDPEARFDRGWVWPETATPSD